DQLPERLERGSAIALEAAKLLRLEHDDPVVGDALVPESEQARLAFVGQRGAPCGVETQMRGRRDFVHVLTAGALGPDRRELDLVVRNFDLGVDAQAQRRSSVATRRFTTSTVPASPSTRTQSPVSMISSGSRSSPVTAGTRITTAPSATFVVISLKTSAFGALPASRAVWKTTDQPDEPFAPRNTSTLSLKLWPRSSWRVSMIVPLCACTPPQPDIVCRVTSASPSAQPPTTFRPRRTILSASCRSCSIVRVGDAPCWSRTLIAALRASVR